MLISLQDIDGKLTLLLIFRVIPRIFILRTFQQDILGPFFFFFWGGNKTSLFLIRY